MRIDATPGRALGDNDWYNSRLENARAVTANAVHPLKSGTKHSL